MKNILVLFLLILLNSCSPYMKVRQYYPNGKIKSKYYIDQNKKVQGLFLGFYENGKKNICIEYKNDTMCGVYIEWYENGNIKVKGKLDSNGKSTGVSEEYYENGKPQTIGRYEEDLEIGVWRYYNENGNLIREEYYEKGVLVKKIEY